MPKLRATVAFCGLTLTTTALISILRKSTKPIFTYGKMADSMDVHAQLGTAAPLAVCGTECAMVVHGRKEPNEATEN